MEPMLFIVFIVRVIFILNAMVGMLALIGILVVITVTCHIGSYLDVAYKLPMSSSRLA